MVVEWNINVQPDCIFCNSVGFKKVKIAHYWTKKSLSKFEFGGGEIMILFLASTVFIAVSPPPNSNLDRGSIVQWCAFLTFLHPSEWQKMQSGWTYILHSRPFRSWISRLSALTSRSGWASVHKTMQFTSESLVALLIIARDWWEWWDLATNMSESVWQFQWLSLLCISFNFWNLFSGTCIYLPEVRTCHILNFGNRLYRYNHQGQHDHNWFIISRSCPCF